MKVNSLPLTLADLFIMVCMLVVSISYSDDWFLEKIIITEGDLPVSKHTFMHNNFIGEQQNNNAFSQVIIQLKGIT